MAKKPIKSINLLPEFLRTDKNSKFLSSTIDQLIQPSELERLDGFIGTKITPTYVSTSDVYLSEPSLLRRDYQLEPALIVKNEFGDIKEAKAIDDLASEIIAEGGISNNFDRLFRSEIVSFDPRIDLDKFVNFQKYYWLVTGPDVITITGKQRNTTSTFSVSDNEIKSAWILSPDGLTEDPTVILYRGNTYNFSVNSDYKFFIKLAPSLGLDDVYNINVTNNGSKDGIVSFIVDENTPTTLYYTSDEVNYVQGKFVIKQSTEDAYIDVENEILGKKTYTSGSGVTLSNGMKIKFGGEVFPEFYRDKEFFVEGVGSSIKLIDYSLLVGSEQISSQFDDDFDVTSFDQYPFDGFRQLPLEPEYLTINRASRDLNPWSRYNRWVHEDIIKISSEVNGKIPNYPASMRAQRPIIEFVSDLQLYNFGTFGIRNVDLIDTTTTDAFSIVEGSDGYHVDGVLLEQGHRVIFNADTDELVKGKIYQVNFLNIDGRFKLSLELSDDGTPATGMSVGVNLGKNYSGKSWWFNGSDWVLSQQHVSLNQAPLFDIFDENGVSYSDVNFYNTDFKGTKVFGYEIGNGANDPVLGFPLSYQNTISVGSYKFKNYFNTDLLSKFENNVVVSLPVSRAFLKINSQTPRLVNMWESAEQYMVPVIQQVIIESTTNVVELNAIDNPDSSIFELQVFVNGEKVDNSDWYITTSPTRCFVNFNFSLLKNEKVLLKIFTNSLANSNGQYETPIGLTNNPLNGPISELTLSEISDHYKTITERCIGFVGQSFGSNNIRDIANISKYGTRLVSNINPIGFSNFFIGIKEHSVVNAIQKSADQYNQFKSLLIKKITELGNINDPVLALDNILTEINIDKDLNSPWFHSEMLGYGTDKTSKTWKIGNLINRIFPIAEDFDPTVLSFRSVLVYINNTQLVLGRDYQFLPKESSIEILTELSVGDELRIDDYFSTRGSYIPATPSKLGLYPKFQPIIYTDYTYVNPVDVIQGHDGSLTPAYGDFRDEIILEFEKRVFNNIKSEYNSEVFDILSVFPGLFRDSSYTLSEINSILSTDFIKWAGTYGVDYLTNKTFDVRNSFTWNYAESLNNVTSKPVSGHWRALFKYFYDTDRPNSHPWEMLGFTDRPLWWEDVYGPEPYTSGNLLLWNDLEKGIIRQGISAGTYSKYARPGLSDMIPVDEFGNIKDPGLLVSNVTSYNSRKSWVFGDHGPAETAWRRSSYWPYAVQRLLAISNPSKYCSLCYDPSRIGKNIAGHLVYGDQKEFLNLRNIKIHGYQDTLTSGYSVLVAEIGLQRTSSYLDTLRNNLSYVDFNIFHKVGGFVSKNKIQIIIDAIEPNSTSPGALLPQESYNLVLNVSNPINTVEISGIIVQRSGNKFTINGYSPTKPYFTIFEPIRNSNTPSITIGGVSEPYVVWTSSASEEDVQYSAADIANSSTASVGHFYHQGQIVLYGNKFYRTKVSHRAGNEFNSDYFQILPSLPITGGVSVQIANGFFQTPINVPYGTEYTNIQELYDMIIGYGKWLESNGFIFDEFNPSINELVDWSLSGKEFLFWSTQNWAENSIITLSPFANRIKYSYPTSVVDNIFDNFNEYKILRENGSLFSRDKLNVTRNNGVCTVDTVNTNQGIYFAELKSVQKEHAMVFDNTTIFNDVIYDIETGYRQRRMKLKGFRTSKWDGDYFSPGFVYDKAEITDWKKYITYQYGDTVRYNGNYYSAKRNVSSSESFDFNDWVLLNKKPVPELIPNFEYKINQFEDFYSLDIENFDDSQQKMAQHLIGYTPRVYMDNIFTNPIGQYKFYQGFVKEKGTKNAVKKMAKASIFNQQGETSFTEEWAFRVGQYGSYTSYEELEIYLQEGSFIENPQVINFVSEKPVSPSDLIYYSTGSGITILPKDYDPSNTFVTTSTNNFKLPNAGYVSFEDITATAYNEISLLDIANADQIANGDVIWLGFKTNGDWDVLRYSLSTARIVGVYVSSPAVDITFVTDIHHSLKIGDVISVTKFNSQVNGVYVVKSIPKLNQITVASSLSSIFNEELLSPGLLYSFNSVRASNFDNLPSDYVMLKSEFGSKFWIDNQSDSGMFNWEVYEKINNFNSRKISSGLPTPNQQMGFSISKRDNSDLILVGSPKFANNIDNGRVFVFLKGDSAGSASNLFSFALNNYEDKYHDSQENTDFGYSVSYSSKNVAGTEYGTLVVGAPVVGNLLIKGSTIKYASETGVLTSSVQAGAVKISSIDPVITNDRTEIVLVSPSYQNYERFGHSVLVDSTNKLYIGAPGTATTGTGSVYVYDIVVPLAQKIVTNTSTTGTTVIYIESSDGVEVGQKIWIENIFEDIINSPTVEEVTESTVTISQNLPDKVVTESKINFYSSSVVSNGLGSFTSTNGILVSFLETLTSSNPQTDHDEYGYSVDSSEDGNVFVIAAPGGNYVESFIKTTSSYVRTLITATIEITDFSRFGNSVSLSKTGDYLFIGAPYLRNDNDSFGKVFVYKRSGNGYIGSSIITNPIPGPGMNFGTKIAVNQTTDTVAISSIGINTSVPVKFDSGSTQFDSSSTFFHDVIENYGTVYVYNKQKNGNRFVLTGELSPSIDTDSLGNNFGYSLALDEDSIYVGAPAIDVTTTSSFYRFSKVDSSKNSLNLYKTYQNTVDIDTIQKVRLINAENETIVDYLDVIDPIKGKIPGIADQELKYKSTYDPAVYSIGTAGVIVDSDTSWIDDHVGELWWDLSTVKYVWYEQGNLTYRKNNWGTLFPGATIDVYEWVSSPYLPSEWSAIADTSAGLTEGISGQPKYVDNSAISVKQIYNPVSNSFRNVYYYWVKNKVTIPLSKNRRISSYQVSSLIADPTGFGIKYAAILGPSAVALANVGSLVVSDNIHLNVAYDTVKNDIPKHTEWALLEEGSSNSMPPVLYEKKLFDSLLGRDSLGNIVPDNNLSERVRYGIEIRPRQSMFKDRKNALREVIQFSNKILLENQITGSYNFSNLLSQELPPDQYTGLYDEVVEDNEGINLIDTRLLNRAILSCTISNGKIRSVSIENPGYGYKIAPFVSIDSGSNGGSGALITTTIDDAGRISSTTIVNGGSGYSSVPKITVRPYSVIVLSDSLYNGKWTKFEWNKENKIWERKQTQKYNTSLYWNYVDWAAPSYNNFIDYTYTVDQSYQLDMIEDIVPGQYVKVKNVGDGRYAILEKAKDVETGTFGKGFNLVYSQNGTIQILDKIWDYRTSNLNFDNSNNYDQTLYDQAPDIELSYILNALKSDIFINELKVNWNLFFFTAVKYALTEQKMLDWAFKTSFINVINYAGLLDQRPVYKLQSSENYEKYIQEVKPYHSQIRTFTSNHQIIDNSNSFISDFDLPSYYNTSKNSFEPVSDSSPLMFQHPWKSWYDNQTFTVGSIVVGNGSNGYLYPPQVTIVTSPGDTGSGATARAYIVSGKVNRIEIINQGSGYKIAPRVLLTGGGDANLTPAVAYAQLYNGKVRNNSIGIKFDRITKSSSNLSREVSDSYICNGSTGEFVLTWYADFDKTKMSVTLDGELVLGSAYRLENYREIYNGYNKDFTKVVFVNNVPSYGQILNITYSKNVKLLNAVDRIIEFYTATSGMPGKDLPQLMSGVEYPGVNLQGIPLSYTTNWDIPYGPFDTGSYADNVSAYSSIEMASNAYLGTDTITLSTTTGISVGQSVNIISATKNQSTLTVFSSQIATPTADVRVISINHTGSFVKVSSTLSVEILSTSSYVYINNILTTVTSYATVEFWNYDNNVSALDTVISGGSWVTGTTSLIGALGVNPEEIIIDGDKFISPNTSYAPEEVIPGEIHESLGISVYTAAIEGAPIIYNGVIDIYKGTTTTSKLSVVPPNLSGLFVTFAGKNFSLSTGTYHLDHNDVSEYSFDLLTNEIKIGPQSHQGKLGYTIIGVGGSKPISEVGIIDNGITYVTDGSDEAEILSISTTASVKSAYVTVNGVSIPKLESRNTSTLGFMLITSSNEPKRAAAHIYNLSTIGTSTVQAWFFGSSDKRFNEFKEQIIEVGTTAQDTFVLDYPPGLIGPAAGNVIVELDNGNGYKRLQPPFISYHIANSNISTYKIDSNIERRPESFREDGVRVYRNGQQLTNGVDYYFNYNDQTIQLRGGVVNTGDELAILGVPSYWEPYADFDLTENTLKLRESITNSKIKIITFANHDNMLVRTETFAGSFNRRFKVSRHIINNNYVYVTVNGIVLVNKYDYTVLEDGRTIELSDKWYPRNTDLVVITTISDSKIAGTVVGYKIFNDIFNRVSYKRLSKQNTTVLTKELYINDTEIHVEDSSVLSVPLKAKKIPGIIFINGERIEYNKIDGNILKNIRRSTVGTSPSLYLPAGTKVVDQGVRQTVPYTDYFYKQVILTSKSTNTYKISTVNTVTSIGVTTSSLIVSDGILLSTTSTVNPCDQIEVYYGGRKLRKESVLYHDVSVSFDSPVANIVGFTSTVAMLPSTDIMNTAYVVTSTNQVWTYTGSIEKDAVNGYVYKGLNYLEPEFSITVSIDTSTAATYATTASQLALSSTGRKNLEYDINGDGIVTSADADRYLQLANGEFVNGINENSNYYTLLNQNITLNIADGVQDNVRLTVVKKGFKKSDIWNNQVSATKTKSLLESTTDQAQFLQAKLSELPNIYYYGEDRSLFTGSGISLTDENNEPLEGL